MHLYVALRGIKDAVDRYVNDLCAQYFIYDDEGKKTAVRLGVRPVQLYELVFPEDQKEEVLGMICPNGENYKGQYKIKKKMLDVLRKFLGLKPLPKKWEKAKQHFVANDYVGVHPIGFKKDKFVNGREQL